MKSLVNDLGGHFYSECLKNLRITIVDDFNINMVLHHNDSVEQFKYNSKPNICIQ